MRRNSLAKGLSDLAASIGEFTAEVRAAMREREAELREGTGLDGTLGKPSETPDRLRDWTA